MSLTFLSPYIPSRNRIWTRSNVYHDPHLVLHVLCVVVDPNFCELRTKLISLPPGSKWSWTNGWNSEWREKFFLPLCFWSGWCFQCGSSYWFFRADTTRRKVDKAIVLGLQPPRLNAIRETKGIRFFHAPYLPEIYPQPDWAPMTHGTKVEGQWGEQKSSIRNGRCNLD